MNVYVERMQELAEEWRKEAELYRRRGMLESAQMAESFAGDLEARLQLLEFEELSLEAAARESGLSYSSIQQQVGTGKLPNAGEKGSPRILRRDLPRVAQRSKASSVQNGKPDLAAEVNLARRLSPTRDHRPR